MPRLAEPSLRLLQHLPERSAGLELTFLNGIFFFFFFLQEHKSTFIYLLSISLNPGWVQHHTDSVSNGLCRKVASEFGTNHTAVSVGPSYLSPDHSGFVWFTSRSHCIVFCFIHISTSLA